MSEQKIKLKLSARDKHIMALTNIMETCGFVVLEALKESIEHKKDPETKKYFEKLLFNSKMEHAKWSKANDTLFENIEDQKQRETITDKSYKMWMLLHEGEESLKKMQLEQRFNGKRI